MPTKRIILIALLLAFSVSVSAQESELPDTRQGVLLHEQGVTEGYILFSVVGYPYAYLIDNDGQLINRWSSEHPIVATYLLPNGHLLISVNLGQQNFPIGGTGRIEEYDWEGNLVWSFEYASEENVMHHDIAPLPNGNVLFAAYERISVEQQHELGIQTMPGGGDLFYDVILEVDRQTSEIVWDWHIVDHLVQDEYPEAATYGFPADFSNQLDPQYQPYLGGLNFLRDRSHINGIDYNAALDEVLVSMWYTGEVWVIDRQLDELVYRWGNPAAYNRGVDGENQLFLQHDPTWLENGDILIFNNGHPVQRRFSSVVRIELPREADGSYRLIADSSYEPVAPVWEWRADPPTDFFAIATSGAQMLPSGNVLISHGTLAHIFEITPEGDTIWEYDTSFLADGVTPARLFKARYYPQEHIACCR